ncbi:MAG: hypothetical protein RL333_891 [Pseudomonadota bacterium]
MKRPTVEILSQGDEVIEGAVINTNAAWLSRKLFDMGFNVVRHTCIGDDLPALVSALQEISGRSQLCISSGGLGPTLDDLTAEAASTAFGAPLQSDPEALRQIESWFQRSGRPMAEINRRQALIPSGAVRLDNDWGTAPGFSMPHGICDFHFVPGVPREMMAMFEHRIAPRLIASFPAIRPSRLTFHTIGIGESRLQELLKSLSLPEGARLGFRAKGTENEVKITFPGLLSPGEADPLISQVSALLGDALFQVVRDGLGHENLASFVGTTLRDLARKVLVQESLSAGNLSHTLALEGALAFGEIHPACNPPLAIEDAAVIEHELQSQADHLLRKHPGESVIIERWYPENGSSLPGEREKVVFWTLAASEHHRLLERQTLTGTKPQLAQTATIWSLNTVRRLLEI